MRKVVAVIQARTGSVRLPAKVLQDIAGRCMLLRVVDRVLLSTEVHLVVVATTSLPEDDQIVQRISGAFGGRVPVARGSPDDVLDRYYHTATESGADIIVRITADCPLVDWTIVDSAVNLLRMNAYDYASNVSERRTFPRGLDVEVLTMFALADAWEKSTITEDREHVTSYIRARPDKYSIGSIFSDIDLSHHRWTVDEPADLEFMRRIYIGLGHQLFTTRDVLRLLEEQPQLMDINREVKQKKNISVDTN